MAPEDGPQYTLTEPWIDRPRAHFWREPWLWVLVLVELFACGLVGGLLILLF